MTTENQDETLRKAAQEAAQEQAERDFVAAREQLAAQDEAQRQTRQEPETADNRTARFLAELDAVEGMTPDELRAEAEKMKEGGGFLGAVAAASLAIDNGHTETDPDGSGSGKPQEPGAEQRPHVDTVWMEPSAELTDADRQDMAEAFKQVPTEGNDNRPELAAVMSEQPEALTLEAIERDPWNAVRLDMPQTDDCELLAAIEGAAGKLAEDAYTRLYEQGPDGNEADNAAFTAAKVRQQEARAALDAQACELGGGDQEKHQEAPEIDPASSFQPAADAATSSRSPHQQQERDLAERIVALESLLGTEDSRAHHVYVAQQRTYGEQINSADSPSLAALYMGAKLAHSLDYAGDLCEQAAGQAHESGDYEQSAYFGFEARTRREGAAEIRNGGPDLDPTTRSEDDKEQIGQDMSEAAKEALGRTVRPVVVVEGPSREQQQGQQAEGPEIVTEPSARGRYASLGEETAAQDNNGREMVADHGHNIRPVIEYGPEGTYIASRPQASYAARETDYEGGPVRPSFGAYAALAATQAAARDDERDEDRTETAAEKEKREANSAERPASNEATASRASNDPLAMLKDWASEDKRNIEREDTAAVEHGHESGQGGRSVGGGISF